MSLLYISQQSTLYGGFFILFAGVIGNGINIFIFSITRTYRTTPSPFFFLVGSVNNLFYLLINLTTRILSASFEIDLTIKSVFFCKARSFFLTTLTLISFTCSCLATIDQFLTTSRRQSFRRCSQIKWAHRILFVMIIVWSLHGIPYFLYNDISPISHTCININAIYRQYTSINFFILLCGIPVAVLIVFGYLAYRNIHQIRVLNEEHADRQLAQMTWIQAALVVISVTPYGVVNIYAVITAGVVKDINQQMKEYFISTIVSLISYLHFAGSFYMFLITSSRFRQTVKDRLFYWRRLNQINP